MNRHAPPEKFAALIAGLEDAGITQATIAQKCQLSRMHVWRLGAGLVRNPGYETITRIEALAIKHGAVTPMLRKTR